MSNLKNRADLRPLCGFYIEKEMTVILSGDNSSDPPRGLLS